MTNLLTAAYIAYMATNLPPIPTTHDVKRVQSDLVTASNLDLFATDYWGPQSVPATWGGVAPFHTLTNQFQAFYNEACGVEHFTNRQTAWFEITLSPNHDCTNRVPHIFAYQIGINGLGTLTVSNRVAGYPTWYACSQVAGNLSDIGDQITNWVASKFYWQLTNDMVLHFQYTSGSTEQFLHGTTNICGVCGLCWEPQVAQQTSYHLRFEPEMMSVGSNDSVTYMQQGTVTHSVKLSWPGYSANIHLYQATNLINAPWNDWSTNFAFLVWLDGTGTRYVLNYPVSTFFHRQHEYFKLMAVP